MRLSGQSAWLASTSMRTMTRAPGAWRAILRSSSSASTANCSTPMAWACAMSAARLMVLPKAMWVAGHAEREAEVDLAARGGVEAAAQRGDRRDHLGRRVGLDRVVDGRVAQARRPARGTSPASRRGRRPSSAGRSRARGYRRPGAAVTAVSAGWMSRNCAGSPAKAAACRMRISISPGGLDPRSSQKRRYRRCVSTRSRGLTEARALASWCAYEASRPRNQAKTDRAPGYFTRPCRCGRGSIKIPLNHNDNRRR